MSFGFLSVCLFLNNSSPDNINPDKISFPTIYKLLAFEFWPHIWKWVPCDFLPFWKSVVLGLVDYFVVCTKMFLEVIRTWNKNLPWIQTFFTGLYYRAWNSIINLEIWLARSINYYTLPFFFFFSITNNLPWICTNMPNIRLINPIILEI